jgi:hypothetical protein
VSFKELREESLGDFIAQQESLWSQSQALVLNCSVLFTNELINGWSMHIGERHAKFSLKLPQVQTIAAEAEKDTLIHHLLRVYKFLGGKGNLVFQKLFVVVQNVGDVPPSSAKDTIGIFPE